MMWLYEEWRPAGTTSSWKKLTFTGTARNVFSEKFHGLSGKKYCQHFLLFLHRAFHHRPICKTNQQMNQFYYYLFFIHQLLLHVSASMCRHQGTRMHLLSYVSRQGLVDKILIVLSCLYYVVAWRVSVCPVMLPRTLVNTNGQTGARQAKT
jgi:hypothetical protein